MNNGVSAEWIVHQESRVRWRVVGGGSCKLLLVFLAWGVNGSQSWEWVCGLPAVS